MTNDYDYDYDINFREKGRSRIGWKAIIGWVASDEGECAWFKLAYDDLGRFYYTYYSYKQQVDMPKGLREKVMFAKKALLNFIDSSVEEKQVEFDDNDGSQNAYMSQE
ncbi:hypothetical protein Peur_032278 [Populus x canadensis]